MAKKRRGRKLSKKEIKAIKKAETDTPVVIQEAPQKPKVSATISLPDVITVGGFAKLLGLDVTEVVKTLIANGIMATINESIDRETAMLVADDYGAKVVNQTGEIVGEAPIVEKVTTKGSILRPPVVVVMGHVDHGKTTLLDTIRKTNVAGGESGGITQHIGAYQIEWHGKGGEKRLITFLDTPGHEAFSAMRAHGASLTDVAILVVAADDGVKPQTKEAVSHARAANVPIIVAINKIDMPGADVDRVKRELMELDLLPEEYGGKIPMVAVSAKQGKNIDELLDVVLLAADLTEPKAEPAGELIGTVIEAQQEIGAGVVATILVQNGTLAVGDTIVVGTAYGRVKFLKTASGERVISAGPSMPVQISGLNTVPAVGQRVERVRDERAARTQLESRSTTVSAVRSLGQVSQAIRRGIEHELPVVLKADVQGSVDAIRTSLEQLSTDTADVRLLHAAVGPVNESDVQLAIASKALIVAFRASISPAAAKMAQTSGVTIMSFEIIYALLDDVKAALEGKLAPQLSTATVGTLKVLKTFRTTTAEKLVGGLVTKGELRKSGTMQIRRAGEIIGTAKILGLQQGPEKVETVPNGQECGVLLGTKITLAANDQLDCVVEESITVRLGSQA